MICFINHQGIFFLLVYYEMNIQPEILRIFKENLQMTIVSIIAIIILTDLVRVVHYLKSSEIAFFHLPVLNSSSLYIAQYTSPW